MRNFSFFMFILVFSLSLLGFAIDSQIYIQKKHIIELKKELDSLKRSRCLEQDLRK